MSHQHILITGGAGFVGGCLAVLLRQQLSGTRVTALDNLTRRGSECVLARLKANGVDFVHGDVRCPDDLATFENIDVVIDCAAEPSVHAGVGGSPTKVFDINLTGTVNCLEVARRCGAKFLFISTSRVYPVKRLRTIPVVETETRFTWNANHRLAGFSERGISENFPLDGYRTFYGASKLASELLIQEYAAFANVQAIINRCGVISGAWQMGKTDQGVLALWVARHFFRRPANYIGYQGSGKQVRDVLHVNDLFDLISLQLQRPELWDGRVYNAGGGWENSISLKELTQICRETTGHRIKIGRVDEAPPTDVPVYVTDNSRVNVELEWKPRRTVRQIVEEIAEWYRDNEEMLSTALG